MHVFIAGVMQGSRLDRGIEVQTYRVHITAALRAHIPDVVITDPWALNPNSVAYGEEEARHTFLTFTQRAGQADVLIAYLPTASMGTAMEMWQAYQNNTAIVAVTPLQHHWAIRFTSDLILPDLESLLAFIAAGRLPDFVRLAAGRRGVTNHG